MLSPEVLIHRDIPWSISNTLDNPLGEGGEDADWDRYLGRTKRGTSEYLSSSLSAWASISAGSQIFFMQLSRKLLPSDRPSVRKIWRKEAAGKSHEEDLRPAKIATQALLKGYDKHARSLSFSRPRKSTSVDGFACQQRVESPRSTEPSEHKLSHILRYSAAKERTNLCIWLSLDL